MRPRFRVRPRSRRVAVYTAIFGGYDRLAPQPDLEGVDWFCFTDDATLRSDRWKIRVAKGRYAHPRLSAKWFKLNPDRVLDRYRRTIWIDASICVQATTFASELVACLADKTLALFPHPDRDNIFDEAAVSRGMVKYAELPVLEQVEHYRRLGFNNRELFACGVLVRDNADAALRRLHRDWMREIVRWTYQDQLSLPFLLWKHRIRPATIPFNLWENHLFSLQAHLSEL
jgi:Protein of unknown function (DUF616)